MRFTNEEAAREELDRIREECNLPSKGAVENELQQIITDWQGTDIAREAEDLLYEYYRSK